MPTPIRHQAPTSGSDQSHCGSYVTRRTRGALRVAQCMTGGHDWRARTRGHGLGARTRGHALEPDGFHAVAPSGSHGARSPGAQRLARPVRRRTRRDTAGAGRNGDDPGRHSASLRLLTPTRPPPALDSTFDGADAALDTGREIDRRRMRMALWRQPQVTKLWLGHHTLFHPASAERCWIPLPGGWNSGLASEPGSRIQM